MPVQIAPLLREIGEVAIAHHLRPIDAQAATSPFERDPIADYSCYRRRMGRHYNHVIGPVLNGGRLPDVQAEGRALRVIEHEYRDRGGDLVSAFQDAVDGTNGGEIAQRQMITDAVKREAAEYYVLAVFDRHVNPRSWEEKVECIRAFIARCGVDLGGAVNPDQPERYAQTYRELLRSYLGALQRTSAMLRRL